jgi:hypothetical protein
MIEASTELAFILSPADYEEYLRVMDELAELQAAASGDPLPQDLGR